MYNKKYELKNKGAILSETGNTVFISCAITGKKCYISKKRLDIMKVRYSDFVERYISREGKTLYKQQNKTGNNGK